MAAQALAALADLSTRTGINPMKPGFECHGLQSSLLYFK
jgi:hypothetical protein